MQQLFVAEYLYWTKLITQLENGSISIWAYDLGQFLWDILLNNP